MEELEVSAKNVEEATQRALEQLGVSREEVEVTVVKEGKQGVLGIGAEEATVIVRPLVTSSPLVTDDKVEIARNIVEALIDKLGLDASVEIQEPMDTFDGKDDTSPTAFEIKGDDLGILIGRQGETLACLQYIARLILANQIKSWLPIIIDVEGYKQRRYQSLREMAQRIASQVGVRGVSFTLKPMPAFERRIIHITLADNPDVTTESTGAGESRRVCIMPREPSE